MLFPCGWIKFEITYYLMHNFPHDMQFHVLCSVSYNTQNGGHFQTFEFRNTYFQNVALQASQFSLYFFNLAQSDLSSLSLIQET